MPQSQQPNPWRYAGLGLELAGAIVVLALVGYWVDHRFGTGPWGVLVGVLIGGVGGMYLFIKEALAANRQFAYDRLIRREGPKPERDVESDALHEPTDSDASDATADGGAPTDACADEGPDAPGRSGRDQPDRPHDV